MHKDGAGPHRGHPSAHAPGPFWSILSALSQEDSTAESLVASLHLQPVLPNRSPLQKHVAEHLVRRSSLDPAVSIGDPAIILTAQVPH